MGNAKFTWNGPFVGEYGVPRAYLIPGQEYELPEALVIGLASAARSWLTSSLIPRYPLPAQTNPRVVQLENKFQTITASDNEDLILLGAPTPSAGSLQINGGHHVRLIAGKWAKTTTGASIRATKITGSFAAEGIEIDGSGYNGDAINACGYKSGEGPGETRPDIYLQKWRAMGINGTSATNHADVYQPQGPIGRLFIDLFTASSSYQALFIPPQSAIASAAISRSNISKIANPEALTTYMLWLFGINEAPYPVTIDRLYITPAEGQTMANASAWPKAGELSTYAPIAGQAIGLVEDGEGNASFPAVSQATGKILHGAPPNGDWVPTGTVGLGYVPKIPS